MTATLYRAQWSAPLYGDPSQNATNTWYFLGAVGSTQAEDIDEVLARVEDFYQAVDNTLFAQTYMGTTSDLIIYDMSDAEPRTPIAGPDNITLACGAGTAAPADVSLCLSYHADYPSGVNRARRRGRLYLGPVLAATYSTVSGQGMRFTPTIIGTVLDAVEQYIIPTQITPITWAVYSPTDNVGRPIVEYSVDNGLDTRRSRDNVATTRTTRAV